MNVMFSGVKLDLQLTAEAMNDELKAIASNHNKTDR